MKKDYAKWILAIFPVLITLLGLLMLGRQTLHYTISSDPEFFYLLSGLNIARFDLISGDFHHPGIPLQIYSGIVIGIDYLFAGKYPDIISDVMLRPEHYITAINGSLFFIIGIIFYLGGVAIYKLTNSLMAAIFLQILPFTNNTAFFQFTLIVPEKIILPIFFVIIVLLIKYIQKDLTGKQERNFIVLMAIMIAISFLQKLTMLPMIFLPLFILKGKKNMITYLISLGAATLVLMVPIITHLQEMYKFLSEMSTHSGLYGGGKKQFIDFETIIPNLTNFYYSHKLTFYSFFISIVILPFTFIGGFARSVKSKKIRRVFLAIVFVEILMMIMLLKHYKAHYATPIIALSLFNFYLIIEFIRESNLPKSKKMFPAVYFLFSVFLIITFYPSTASIVDNFKVQEKYENQLIKVSEQFQNMPKLFLPRYYGTPFVDFSIWQGIYNSRNYKLYGDKAKALYPRSYIYTAEWGLYDMTYKNFTLPEVLNEHKNFILSYYDDDQATLDSFYKELEDANLGGDYTFKKLYYNDVSKAVIVQMTKKDFFHSYELIYSVSWDMEEPKSQLEKPAYSFSEKKTTNKISLSGSYSLILSENDEYGAQIEFDSLQAGDIIQVNLWRFRNGNESGIVISADSANKFYKLSTEVIEAVDFWDKIELIAKVPADIENQKVKVYLWQSDKSGPVYFDDLNVSVYRKEDALLN